jgi:putative restriction endonuclease
VVDLADYLDLTVSQAREQFRALLMRRPVQGGGQVTFLPVETLLCLAASFVVNHRHFGGGTAHRAPEPVPSLGRLFARPPSSVLAKMANLDGSRSHGGRWDVLAGAMLREDPARFSDTYRILLHAARAEGIGPARLPDFLGLEQGGDLALLGQEELDISVLEAALRDQVIQQSGVSVWSDLETERILLAAARVGQHVFARQVLANCGSRCVFCGLRPASFGATRMLLAGHIKPWKDSTPSERLDPRNGLAACPAHDVAFDTGMLTVNGGLRIHLARQLADAIQADPLARQYYGKPPLHDVILLPEGAPAPARKYLDWHRQRIFVNGSVLLRRDHLGSRPAYARAPP